MVTSVLAALFILQHQKNGSKFIIQDNRMIITNVKNAERERERKRERERDLGSNHTDEGRMHSAFRLTAVAWKLQENLNLSAAV
jgi:hypothetical protein